MDIKRLVIAATLIILIAAGLVAAGNQQDMQVRLYPQTKQDWLVIPELHLDIVYRDVDYIDIITDPGELATLQDKGYITEVVHESVAAFYRSRLDITKDMGGYKTLDEVNAYLDTIIADHPTLVSPKESIGLTIEGRDMWTVKISDNPTVDEDEPEILYFSAIHAREVITPEVLFHFMDFLTDNYGINPTATDLVDNREMWFVIVANPDGYYHNQVLEPGGGGMWRKNRRNNGDGTFGVDLNRNYGYMWGYDDIGSSPYTDDPTYRGTGPFSEPESQNMRDFIEGREFVITVSYHSHSDLIIWPYGYDYIYTPDENLFSALGDSASTFNGYAPGPIWTLYPVNGNTDDWGYGEQTTKNKNIALTLEVGDSDDGFWPNPSDIGELVGENLQPNILFAEAAGDLYSVMPPDAPVISAPVQTGTGPYSVSWTHNDTLNPAVNYELAKLEWPEIVTYPADNFDTWENRGFVISGTRSHSAPNSFYSGSGNSLNRHVQSEFPIEVATDDTLRLWTYYDIEVDWDYAYVEVSTNGQTFAPIEGNITTNYDPHGNNRGNGITGLSGGWVEALFDLSTFDGQEIYIRLTYQTDGAVVEEGFFADDIYPHLIFNIESFHYPAPPTSTSITFTGDWPSSYYYRVRAIDTDNQYSQWSELVMTEVVAEMAGDMDLDGITSSIADYVLFNLYFIYGLTVFDVSIEAQIAQSDINCDGTPLSVADMITLMQVILGVEEPCYGGTFKDGSIDIMTELVGTRPGGQERQSTGMLDDPSYAIAIENTNIQNQDTGYVDIVMTDSDTGLVGFQFYLEYDTAGLQLLDVQFGADFTNWNSLGYNEQITSETARLLVAANAWDFGGIIDENDIAPQPTPRTIVRLKFALDQSGDPFTRDIKFVWEKCGDNNIAVGHWDSGMELDGLALSRTVYDADLIDITSSDPTYGGVADYCDDGLGGPVPIRAIDFTSGRLTYNPSCCIGLTGNIDCSLDDVVDISDLTDLISHLFISYLPLCCPDEADMAIPQDSVVDVADLTAMIDRLFISFDDLPFCP